VSAQPYFAGKEISTCLARGRWPSWVFFLIVCNSAESLDKHLLHLELPSLILSCLNGNLLLDFLVFKICFDKLNAFVDTLSNLFGLGYGSLEPSLHSHWTSRLGTAKGTADLRQVDTWILYYPYAILLSPYWMVSCQVWSDDGVRIHPMLGIGLDRTSSIRIFSAYHTPLIG